MIGSDDVCHLSREGRGRKRSSDMARISIKHPTGGSSRASVNFTLPVSCASLENWSTGMSVGGCMHAVRL